MGSPKPVLAKELGPKKIRVNSINPGGTETEGAHALGVMGSEFEKPTHLADAARSIRTIQRYRAGCSFPVV
jgi:NAD(P)-dependent dehydrogenase (short-subunit alcohol dehydrogenase family)